jgi:hypothetical protein
MLPFIFLGFLGYILPYFTTPGLVTTVTGMTVKESSSSFPLGVYWPLKTEDLDAAKNIGLDTVILGYDGNTSLKESPEYSAIALLNHCETIQMNVIFELSYFLRWNDLEHLSPNITLLREYSCISTWYIVDEPGISQNGTRIDENAIIQAHNIISGLDERPTFVQYSDQFLNYPDLYDEVPDFVDIISIDPYPWSGNRSKVSSWVDYLNDYNSQRATMWTVLQAHAHTSSPQYFPTEEQFLMDAALALQRNVTGLLWFTFGDYNLSEIPYYGVRDDPNSWEAFGNLIHRIRSIREFVLTSTENSAVVQQNSISYAYRSSSNAMVLFITNHNYTYFEAETTWFPQNVSIFIPRTDINQAFIARAWGLEPVPLSQVRDGLSVEFEIYSGAILLLLAESYINEFVTNLAWWFFGFFFCIVIFLNIKQKYLERTTEKLKAN